MPQEYPTGLASSQDATQISLTITSISKVLIGLIGYYAVSKGMDAATATTELQAIIDLIAQTVPLAFALYHAMMTAWGLIRKFFTLFKK